MLEQIFHTLESAVMPKFNEQNANAVLDRIIINFVVVLAMWVTSTVSYAGSLHTAIQQGDLGQVRQEIVNGADVNKEDILLGGPLLLAIIQGNAQIVELLIGHGASIKAKDGVTGTPPLYAAAAHGHLSVLKILIEHGANIDAVRTSDGETPLHAAAQGGNVEIVELLISLGADVNARSRDDYAPIHSAAASDHFEVAELLRIRGASPRPIDPVAPLMHLADPEEGAKIFSRCRGCHNVKKGGPNRYGPNLWGIVGRKKGSLPGFDYSSALIRHGGVWTYETLNAFIILPTDFIPGTKMITTPFFGGVKGRHQRAHIIAYLRQLSDKPAPLPSP